VNELDESTITVNGIRSTSPIAEELSISAVAEIMVTASGAA
jgi:hypothetical protein